MNQKEYRRMMDELKTKDQSQILNEVLQEIENDDTVSSRRPELSDEIHQDKYNIPTSPNPPMMINSEIGNWNVIFYRIANMLNSGLSPNIGIFGKSQRGKSNTALYIGHVLHNKLNLLRDKFNPEYQTIYEVLPFLLFYRHSSRSMIMFDEAGETLNKNDYNTKMNKSVAGTLRTQGKKQIVNCFITTEYNELDPRIKGEIDIEIEMVSTGKARVNFYEKIHGKKAEAVSRDNKWTSPPGKWNVPKAPTNIREVYDELDSNYKGRYLDRMIKDVIQEKKEEQEKGITEL